MIKNINKIIPKILHKSKNLRSSKYRTKSTLLKTMLTLSLGFSTLSQANSLGIYDTNFEEKYSNYILEKNTDIGGITFRFIDGIGVQLVNGVLTYDSQNMLSTSITNNEILTSINIIESLLQFENLSLFSPFGTCLQNINLPAKTREDMNSYESVNLPLGSKFKDYESLLASLNQLKIVEIAYSEPIVKPSSFISQPINGSTPNLESHQGYLGAAPGGINALFAWGLDNGAGENVNIIDIEYAWRLNHEDMPTLFYNSGHFYVPPATPYWEQIYGGHGTAVLGVLAAKNNGFGLTGIAHNANIGVQSEWDNGAVQRVAAVCDALEQLNTGDILLLEQQTYGPVNEYLPVEWEPAMFTAIQHATQNEHIIVVEAAANGNRNLDSSNYNDSNGNNLFDLNFRDSGAIMVGASHSTSRTRMSFSNYGSRVTVNAWGENVASLGRDMIGGEFNHQFFYLSGQNQAENFWYRSGFNGTSSASPIVAGSAAIIQSISDHIGLPRLDSVNMRNLLESTGTPQVVGNNGNIGSQPDLQAAISYIVTPVDLVPTINILTPSDGSNIPRTNSFNLTAQATDDIGILGVTWVVSKNGTVIISELGFGTNYLLATGAFSTAGLYTISAIVEDTSGQTSIDTHSITVNDDVNIIPSITLSNFSSGFTPFLIKVNIQNQGPNIAHNIDFSFNVTSGTGTASISNLPPECSLISSTVSPIKALAPSFNLEYQCLISTLLVNENFSVDWDSACPGGLDINSSPSLLFNVEVNSLDENNTNLNNTDSFSYWNNFCWGPL